MPTVNGNVLFYYIYRPLRNAQDGGFTMALYGDGTLLFTMYDQLQQQKEGLHFLVAPEVVQQVYALIQRNMAWIGQTQVQIPSATRDIGYVATFGFPGGALYALTDMELTMQAGFGNASNHQVRRLYLMLEDVAEILAPAGFLLTPASFRWDKSKVNLVDEDRPVAI